MFAAISGVPSQAGHAAQAQVAHLPAWQGMRPLSSRRNLAETSPQLLALSRPRRSATSIAAWGLSIPMGMQEPYPFSRSFGTVFMWRIDTWLVDLACNHAAHSDGAASCVSGQSGMICASAVFAVARELSDPSLSSPSVIVMMHRTQTCRASRRAALAVSAMAGKFDYDLVIIGCGVGGHGAALHAVESVSTKLREKCAVHATHVQGRTPCIPHGHPEPETAEWFLCLIAGGRGLVEASTLLLLHSLHPRLRPTAGIKPEWGRIIVV